MFMSLGIWNTAQILSKEYGDFWIYLTGNLISEIKVFFQNGLDTKEPEMSISESMNKENMI